MDAYSLEALSRVKNEGNTVICQHRPALPVERRCGAAGHAFSLCFGFLRHPLLTILCSPGLNWEGTTASSCSPSLSGTGTGAVQGAPKALGHKNLPARSRCGFHC